MSTGIQTNANPTALPGTTVHFLRALEMLFRAGRYYPAAHHKTRELADAFRAAAHEVALGSGRLVFEVRNGVLHLQGEAVPPDVPGAAGFLALLEPLAVARLTLDADIGRSDLHALVNLLPQLQQQVVEARIDERFVFRGFPTASRSSNANSWWVKRMARASSGRSCAGGSWRL